MNNLKIDEYTVVQNLSPSGLTDAVNTMIAKGWVPCGGLAYEAGRGLFVQAMVSNTEARKAAALARD
jgi:IMP dehydrogenase/GMP reductase